MRWNSASRRRTVAGGPRPSGRVNLPTSRFPIAAVSNGSVFNTLSGAADKLTGKSNNGWTFWQVARDGGWHDLAAIRQEYLEKSSAD